MNLYVTLIDVSHGDLPANWTGPRPSRYWSFDTLDNVTLMEGNRQTTIVRLFQEG